MASGSFIAKTETEIRGTGYCVDSLEAALGCFFNTDSFDEAVLRAVNLGDDADTTSTIIGPIAGAYSGHFRSVACPRLNPAISCRVRVLLIGAKLGYSSMRQ
ncbi:ADP-ribosylglycohydrolase family protein [Collimonas sp. OK412]|uniref:ADP-ribosylglycohydrolase family protein n=1 Tax=Collimonas sp. (strain OK412) TaxID=1801619 RepID=UPI0020C8FE3D|nr:ADP-ribosylglycohydrolase family protein [Collimonas sp. OK412]